jgi:hypothetical protein
LFSTNKKNIKQMFLNLRSSIKDNMLWVFFSSYFFLKERKESKTPQTFLLKLDANKDNSKAILESSFIKLTKGDGFVIFYLNFKHIVMVDCNASKSNQWLLYWFRTQVVTIGD